MNTEDKAELHPFDHLRMWSAQSDHKLREIASSGGLAIMAEIIPLLNETLSPEESGLSVETFPQYVRELYEKVKKGSRELSEAILAAQDCRDAGDIAGARTVYDEFLRRSDAPFYRRIAQMQLGKLL